jgi:hypothetical protein
MTSKFQDVDRIEIRRPCSFDWELMSGDDLTRFCSECNKQVYDFSRMTRNQIETLVAGASGRLCARFSRRPDGTIVTADSLTGSAVIRRRAPVSIGAALAAVLSLCASAFAQSPANPAATKRRPPYVLQRGAAREDEPRSKNAQVHGTISDQFAAVIRQVQITVVNDTTKRAYTTMTDDEGTYRFTNLEAGSYSLTAESSGFVIFRKSQIGLKPGEDVRLDATLQVGMMGEVVILPKHGARERISDVLLFPARAFKKVFTGKSR